MSLFAGYSAPEIGDAVERMYVDGQKFATPVLRASGIVSEETKKMNSGLVEIVSERVDKEHYADVKAEGGKGSAAKWQTGYKKPVYIETREKHVNVTLEARTGGKTKDIIDDVMNMGSIIPDTIDLELGHRFSFINQTSYSYKGKTMDLTTGAGTALYSTTQPLFGSATTYRTALATNPQFSKGALEFAMKTGIENSYDNLGQTVSAKFNTLLISDDPETMFRAKELTKATSDSASNNSGTYNVFGGSMLKVVVAPRISYNETGTIDPNKRKCWGLIDTDRFNLKLVMLKDETFENPMKDGKWNYEDVQTQNWMFRVYAMYGIGVVSGRGIVWSLANGAA